MKGLHVEVQLLAALVVAFAVMVLVLVLTAAPEHIVETFVVWTSGLFGALMLAIKGNNTNGGDPPTPTA